MLFKNIFQTQSLLRHLHTPAPISKALYHNVKKTLPVIAIDGPAASGKSTVANILAQKLGFKYLDSGSLYRCATLLAFRNKLTNLNDDIKQVDKLDSILSHSKISISKKTKENGINIYINDENVTGLIRTADISNYVGVVAKFPSIRDIILIKQRELAGFDVGNTNSSAQPSSGLVMDGRDIGTRVFPNAMLKIFMLANPESRAKRRYLELQKSGTNANVTFDSVLSDIKARDHIDYTRTHSPLRKAEDAVTIDTSDLNIEQVVQKIEDIYSKLKK